MYIMKLLICLLASILLLAILQSNVYAAKILPQARGGGSQVTSGRSGGSGIAVSPRLRGDRQALVVSFGNLQNAKNVNYQLIYNANGQNEGAGGTISSSGNSASRELLFGTCSRNVCTYHKNITNMKLEVTYTASSGKKFLKRYRIKV